MLDKPGNHNTRHVKLDSYDGTWYTECNSTNCVLVLDIDGIETIILFTTVTLEKLYGAAMYLLNIQMNLVSAC